MKSKELKKLETLPFFTKETIRSLNKGATKSSLDQSLRRWVASGVLIRIKRGVYVTKRFFDLYRDRREYSEFLSSVIRFPSYVSTEYVLQQLNVLTEATYGITSVTLKVGRTYQNKLGAYVYRNIKKPLFTGYSPNYFLDNEYYLATPAKALFDFLYFKSGSLGEGIDERNIVEELRLNLEDYSQEDFEELASYSVLAESSKINTIVKNITKNAPDYS